MKTVPAFFNNMSDERLRKVVRVILAMRSDGYDQSDVLPELAHELADATRIPYLTARALCETEPLRMAAQRWIAQS